MNHILKCAPAPFAAIRSGIKGFEYRRNDRDYKVGDTLELQEWSGSDGFTGQSIYVKVIYMLTGPSFGVPEGYCVMQIREEECDLKKRIAELEDGLSFALHTIDNIEGELDENDVEDGEEEIEWVRDLIRQPRNQGIWTGIVVPKDRDTP